MRWHERLVLLGGVAMIVGVAWFLAAMVGRPDVIAAAAVLALVVGLVLVGVSEMLRWREDEP